MKEPSITAYKEFFIRRYFKHSSPGDEVCFQVSAGANASRDLYKGGFSSITEAMRWIDQKLNSPKPRFPKKKEGEAILVRTNLGESKYNKGAEVRVYVAALGSCRGKVKWKRQVTTQTFVEIVDGEWLEKKKKIEPYWEYGVECGILYSGTFKESEIG